MPAVIYSEINPVTAAYSRPEGERVVVNGDVVGRAGKEKERDRERERDGAERVSFISTYDLQVLRKTTEFVSHRTR